MTTNISTYFDADVVDVARRMIGACLMLHGVGGTIVETEAYAADDPASHSFNGPTTRNSAMFSAPGTIYVYRSYGIHWCVNIVCRPGSAVLIRALRPEHGLDVMRARRNTSGEKRLCAGPGCLTQALAIDIGLNGRPIGEPPVVFRLPQTPIPVVSGQRIGISKAVDHPWRFGEAGSRFLSRPLTKKGPSPS